MWNAVSKIETAITIGGIKLTILDEPDDPMVWISLAESDVPEGTEAFCFAGGDTLDDAIGKAIELFTVCADQLAAFRTLERATTRNAEAGADGPPESVGAQMTLCCCCVITGGAIAVSDQCPIHSVGAPLKTWSGREEPS